MDGVLRGVVGLEGKEFIAGARELDAEGIQEVGGDLEGTFVRLFFDGGTGLGEGGGAEGAGAASEAVGGALDLRGFVAGDGELDFPDAGVALAEEERGHFSDGIGPGGAGELRQVGEGGAVDGVFGRVLGQWAGGGGFGFGGEAVGHSVHGATQDTGEGLDAHGFGEVVVHAGAEATFAGAGLGHGGHGDDVDGVGEARVAAFALADFAGGFEAVDFGELTIHEDEIERDDFEGAEDFGSGGDGLGLVAEFFEDGESDTLIDGVVFGDEDEGLAGARGQGDGGSGTLDGAAVEPEPGFVLRIGSQEAGDGVDEQSLADGFGEEGADTAGAEEGGVGMGSARGDEQEAESGEGGILAHGEGEVVAVDRDRAGIEDGEIEGLGGGGGFLERAECLVGVGGGGGLDAERGGSGLEHAPAGLAVVEH